MKKTSKSAGARGAVLGGEAYDAIARVEGLALTTAGRKRAADAAKKKLTPAEARAAIIAAYSNRGRKA